MNRIFSPLLLIALLAASSQVAFGQDELSREELNFFEAKIRPVLIKECYGCHSAKTGATKGGLMVDTKDALLMGGDSGPAITPGDLDESLLWGSINHEDYNMPPGKMLSDKVIEDFKKWIEMGAPDPRVMKVTEIKSEITPEDVAKGREFWAFKPPALPSIPKVADETWAETEIDRFVLSKLEQNKLQPAGDADPETVLRRLTYGLVGLPPTPAQITRMNKDFRRDPKAAIEKVVDELLKQQQFGERWGRHWLDVARYGESSGREINVTYAHAWRYRDYVIDSFNADKPYDEFVQEQIAGDLLPISSDEDWAENLVATGFLAMGPKALAEQNGRQFRLDLIDEQVDVTSRAILGVSVACARCHDHKFDPIPQADYYAMSGIFENTSTHYGTIDTLQNRRPSNLILLPIEDPMLKKNKLSRKELQDMKDKLADVQEKFREATIARRQMRRGGESKVDPQQATINVARLSTQKAALEAKINSYDSKGNPHTYAMGVQEVDKLVQTRLLDRGEFDRPGQIVERGFPQVMCEEPAELNSKSSGRLELARWMGSDKNPLTARVMVNRIWQHMMGQAIVRTPENFGATGQAPTHPELLDWLAVKFVEENWSVKAIVREIAVSHIYRTGSQYDSAAFNEDPTNELLWRYEPRRLDAEAIRDSLLTVGGQLDRERPYASIAGAAGEGLVRNGVIFSVADKSNSGGSMQSSRRGRRNQGGQSRMGQMMANMTGTVVTTLDQPVTYRSVYLPVVRENIARSMEVFDFAESSMVIGTRETSNTPDQGLYFLNNKFVIEQSEKFARRLMDEHAGVEDQVRSAFLWAYGRQATNGEISAAKEFYEQFDVSNGRGNAALKKLTALCQGILASAEFRFLN